MQFSFFRAGLSFGGFRQVMAATLIASGSFNRVAAQPENVAPAHDATAGKKAATGPTPAVSEKVEDLLAQMTLEEKIGQLVLFTSGGAITGPTGEIQDLESQIRNGHCGNIFNALTVAKIARLQKIAVEQSRLKIPLLFGYDVIHGYKTIFPIPLGEASSWDLKAIEKDAQVAAAEAAAGGLNWTFAPMVDITRDPRWGRIAESSGEDVFLSSQIAAAKVRGFQGTDLAGDSTILSCVKHFAAYGAVQAGRDYSTVDLSERTLREVYLPPYKAAVDAGSLSVMTSFNEINGVPATANRYLLQNILRDEWGFKGFVVTDYTAINELTKHGSASTEYDAGEQALSAGVDMDMQGGVYFDHLKQMVAQGDISEKLVTESARRILTVKFMLGLFDDPYRHCDEKRESKQIYAPENLEAAHDMACKSMVLLKNSRQVLPLTPHANIAVIGPLARAKRDLLGTWAGRGDSDRVHTILESIQKANDGHVAYAAGCGITSRDRSGFAGAVQAAAKADVVVLVLGESAAMSGEAASRTSISLPGVQTDLLREIKKTGKPVVVVLLNGRPLALEEESVLADALLEAWHPGTEGGRAIADTLFGVNNPSGKLPVTFPRNLGQVPIFYSMKNTGRPFDPAQPKQKYRSIYLDCANDPLYPFGFGLSYTKFEYSGLRISRKNLTAQEKLVTTINLTNTGKYDGEEVVQLYLHNLGGGITHPVLELKGFQRVHLKAGEQREVTFTIGNDELTFLRSDMTWGVAPSDFQIFVGPHSGELYSTVFSFRPAGEKLAEHAGKSSLIQASAK